ncbi:hypothetical protein [Haladaptatus sp. CMAA 1911]
MHEFDATTVTLGGRFAERGSLAVSFRSPTRTTVHSGSSGR